MLIALDRTNIIYVVFQAHGFLWALIADARSFQTFSTILDWLTHLASISCWYQSDARQDEFTLSQVCVFFGQPENTQMPVIVKQWNTSYALF